MTSVIVQDGATAANKSRRWTTSLLVGFAGFALFYWMVPSALELWSADAFSKSSQPNALNVVLNLLDRRIATFKLIGITLALIGVFFALRNYMGAKKMDRKSTKSVGLVARFMARWLD